MAVINSKISGGRELKTKAAVCQMTIILEEEEEETKLSPWTPMREK